VPISGLVWHWKQCPCALEASRVRPGAKGLGILCILAKQTVPYGREWQDEAQTSKLLREVKNAIRIRFLYGRE
jgi:hypothetical protein